MFGWALRIGGSARSSGLYRRARSTANGERIGIRSRTAIAALVAAAGGAFCWRKDRRNERERKGEAEKTREFEAGNAPSRPTEGGE